jgi:16S rRNA (cytosine967-C5)-methyltransferase
VLDEEPRIALRVNAARATRDDVLAALARANVAAESGEDPLAIRVADRARLFDAPPFRAGLVEVQDEGSQAVVALCAARAGERWLDLCAGSGGKALALAAQGARVVAWDASARRLGDLPKRARRAALTVEVAREPPGGRFDGVLVDAPCSGSGALAREPDARWRIDVPSLARLVAGQAEILARAAPLVREGGALVYATCSLLREEGEERVAELLARGGFDLEAESRRWPHRHPGAGFYMARLRRRPSEQEPEPHLRSAEREALGVRVALVHR